MTEKQKTTRLRVLLWWNILIVLLVAAAWGILLTYRDGGLLSTRGIANLRYYTVLSNFLAAFAALALAVQTAGVLRGRRTGLSHGVFVWKLVAGAAVSVTFLVVAVFFGPWVGYGCLYHGANFFYHLVVPLLAAGEFVFLDRFDHASFRETLWAFLPPLFYGLGYCLNLALNGVGEWPDTNDFYGFLHWGLPVGLCIFGAILLTSWGAACLLRRGNRAGRRNEKEEKR